VRIARRLRAETTMTLQWIADRLKMGAWTRVTNRLYYVKALTCGIAQNVFLAQLQRRLLRMSVEDAL
jgi:hypothetical protein